MKLLVQVLPSFEFWFTIEQNQQTTAGTTLRLKVKECKTLLRSLLFVFYHANWFSLGSEDLISADWNVPNVRSSSFRRIKAENLDPNNCVGIFHAVLKERGF